MINIKKIFGMVSYHSELDDFLCSFDRQHPKWSASQREEHDKHAWVFKCRDEKIHEIKKETFWNNF